MQKLSPKASRGWLTFLTIASGVVAIAEGILFVWHLLKPDGRNWLDTWYPLLMALIFGAMCITSVVALRSSR